MEHNQPYRDIEDCNEDYVSKEKSEHYASSASSKVRRFLGSRVPLYMIIACLTVALIIVSQHEPSCQDPSQMIYSPAQDAIKYHVKVFAENFVTKGPYMAKEEDGIPSDEADELWEDLFQFGITKISGEQALKLPNRTTEVPTMPDQYVVQLDVFHQLHCLNAIRKTLYPERYWNEFDDYYTADGQRNYTSTAAKHYDHCLDAIRQSIMCHGDIATVYWQWMPVRQQPLPRLEITHTCRDFDAIRDWAKEHQLKGDETILQWRPAPEDTFKLSPTENVVY